MVYIRVKQIICDGERFCHRDVECYKFYFQKGTEGKFLHSDWLMTRTIFHNSGPILWFRDNERWRKRARSRTLQLFCL